MTYLEKLRALKSQKGADEVLTKLTKRSPSVESESATAANIGFVSFVSAQGRGFSNFPGGYGRVLTVLEARCPDLVSADCWQQCVADAQQFLVAWGEPAEALEWSARDLFGLAPVPAQPHPSYRRLSRYDETGLLWLLQGRPVVALAAIQSPTGAVTVYRRFNKPALGPLGDSLDDLG
jgi:hypothetical protein